MPLALTLGVITGVLAFVPFFGAIAAGVLVVLLAFTQGPEQALWATLLFVGIQQVEELLTQPFVQRWAVRLPPALGLMSVLIFSLLFGPLGAYAARHRQTAPQLLRRARNTTRPARTAVAQTLFLLGSA